MLDVPGWRRFVCGGEVDPVQYGVLIASLFHFAGLNPGGVRSVVCVDAEIDRHAVYNLVARSGLFTVGLLTAAYLALVL